MRGQSFSTMFVATILLIMLLTKLHDRVSKMEWLSLRFRIIKKFFHRLSHLPYFRILLCHHGSLSRRTFFASLKWYIRTGRKGASNVTAIG